MDLLIAPRSGVDSRPAGVFPLSLSSPSRAPRAGSSRAPSRGSTSGGGALLSSSRLPSPERAAALATASRALTLEAEAKARAAAAATPLSSLRLLGDEDEARRTVTAGVLWASRPGEPPARDGLDVVVDHYVSAYSRHRPGQARAGDEAVLPTGAPQFAHTMAIARSSRAIPTRFLTYTRARDPGPLLSLASVSDAEERAAAAARAARKSGAGGASARAGGAAGAAGGDADDESGGGGGGGASAGGGSADASAAGAPGAPGDASALRGFLTERGWPPPLPVSLLLPPERRAALAALDVVSTEATLRKVKADMLELDAARERMAALAAAQDAKAGALPPPPPPSPPPAASPDAPRGGAPGGAGAGAAAARPAGFSLRPLLDLSPTGHGVQPLELRSPRAGGGGGGNGAAAGSTLRRASGGLSAGATTVTTTSTTPARSSARSLRGRA